MKLRNLAYQLVAGAVMTAVLGGTAMAQVQSGINKAQPSEGPTNLPNVFQTVGNILMYLAGALAVLAIVYGGLRYVTSAGDAARVKAAKDTILYGIIGLVVAMLGWAVVNFIVGAL